jgi:ubiquinol-cytochrome c reductase cytochrome c subunit
MRRVGALLGVLALAGALYATGEAPARGQAPPAIERGRELFLASCASCHGPAGRGTAYGPDISAVGAAAFDFQLRTGRMPLTAPGAPTVRKPPAFAPEDIAALVAYGASLGQGPPVPKVYLVPDELALGARLFRENCAPCHGATANGGAVGGNAFAPSLQASAPLDVAEAMVTGPGQMPVFGFSEQERNAIVTYVARLQEQRAPGGLDIGGIGPVPEGFVAWTVGLGTLVAAVVFVAGRGRR